MNIALSVTARRHQRLHNTGKANFVGSLLELLKCLGIEILCRAQSKLTGSKVTDGPAVHGVVDGLCARHHLYALFLEIEEALGAYGLYFWDDYVGAVFPDHCLKRISIEHGEHLSLVSHLHSWSIIITVASHDILSGALCCNNKFTAQLT